MEISSARIFQPGPLFQLACMRQCIKDMLGHEPSGIQQQNKLSYKDSLLLWSAAAGALQATGRQQGG